MISAKSICEEFSDEVKCLYKYNIKNPEASYFSGEIKCRVDIKYFTSLVERLVGVGYCCTQVQKDPSRNKCIAWFQPMTPDD